MATLTDIRKWRQDLDDWSDAFWRSVIDDAGRLRNIHLSKTHLAEFQERRGRKLVQSAAFALLKNGHFEAVLSCLLKELNLLLTWGKWSDPEDYRDRPEPETVRLRETARTLAVRAADMSIWIVGCSLPDLAGVDWNRLAELLARLKGQPAQTRRKLLVRIEAIRELITSSVVDAPAKPKRKRTAKGETPGYVWDAVPLLQQSGGAMSTRRIAKEIGCDYSALSRHPMFKRFRTAFQKGDSSSVDQLWSEARKANSSPKKLLFNMKGNTSED